MVDFSSQMGLSSQQHKFKGHGDHRESAGHGDHRESAGHGDHGENAGLLAHRVLRLL